MHTTNRIGLASVGLSIVLLSTPTAALAQDGEAGLWDRLRGMVTAGTDRLQGIVESQERAEEETDELTRQLDHGRRVRQMHREAVLLSELNIAWIHDQLDDWDCRLAERKQLEVADRIAELVEFGTRIDAVCSGVSARDAAQQSTCARQRADVADAVAELDGLAARYATQCAAGTSPNATNGGEQPWR